MFDVSLWTEFGFEATGGLPPRNPIEPRR